MHYEIYYLPFAGMDDDGNPEPEREMSHKMELDDHTPTPEEIADLWVKQTEGKLNEDGMESDEDALGQLWQAYNRGGGGHHPEMDEKEMRSMSKNDIVVLGGTGYLIEDVGWSEIEMPEGDA